MPFSENALVTGGGLFVAGVVVLALGDPNTGETLLFTGLLLWLVAVATA